MPTPPGPVSVTSWTSGSAIRPASSASSRSRPTSRVSERGRFEAARTGHGRKLGLLVHQERRVAVENPLLEPRQRLSRLEPELGREQPSRSSVRLECVGLAAGTVQRQHQLSPQPLLEAVLGEELLELRHELARGTAGQAGVEAQDDRLQALLLERPAPLAHAPLSSDVGKRVAAEQAERLAQQRLRALRIGARLLDELIETPHVELKRPRLERVARRPEDEQPAEQPAQLREVDVQCRHRAGRRVLSPELVDQAIA